MFSTKTYQSKILALSGLSLCALTLLAQKKEAKKPNVIVILTDDMGFSDIGCYGSEINTPNIDKLAMSGVRFTQFYNTARSSCSRASLLTGLYPHEANMGFLSNYNYSEPGYGDDLSKNSVTLAEVLKSAGYSTYMSGKWHISKNIEPNGDKSNWPLQRGFDRFFGTLNGSDNYFDPGTLMSQNNFIAPAKDFYYTYAIADTAANYVRHQPKDKPFFMYVSFTAAHWPLQAPENEIAKYKGKYDIGWDSVRENRFAKQKKLGIIPKNTVLSTRSEEIPAWKDETMKPFQERRMETYAAMVDAMDQGVGKILKALKENGELENTVIIYMHDNGGCAELEGSDKPEISLNNEQKSLKPIPADFIQMNKKPEYTRDGKFVRSGRGVMAGPADTWMAYGPEWANVSNTPFRLYKSYVHQGGIASPLIINWRNGIKSKGNITRQLSHLIDIVPTVLEITGAKYPEKLNENTIQPLEGISLVPAFKNKIVDRNLIFWEHSANRAIRIGNWKLVAKVKTTKVFTPEDENVWELYDLEKDPSEMINLASKYPEKVKEMAGLWQKEAFRAKALPWPWNKK